MPQWKWTMNSQADYFKCPAHVAASQTHNYLTSCKILFILNLLKPKRSPSIERLRVQHILLQTAIAHGDLPQPPTNSAKRRKHAARQSLILWASEPSKIIKCILEAAWGQLTSRTTKNFADWARAWNFGDTGTLSWIDPHWRTFTVCHYAILCFCAS